jgi:DNA-binding NarL/FixJ family response regulator
MLTCLIVDDSQAFRETAADVLRREGLEVVGAVQTVDEAFAAIESLDPDVALVDVMLGTENGVEVARRLADRNARTKVILISTHAESDLGEAIAQAPAAGFLPKSELSKSAIVELIGPAAR